MPDLLITDRFGRYWGNLSHYSHNPAPEAQSEVLTICSKARCKGPRLLDQHHENEKVSASVHAICTQLCMCVCMYIYIYVWMYKYVYIYTYTHIHI